MLKMASFYAPHIFDASIADDPDRAFTFTFEVGNFQSPSAEAKYGSTHCAYPDRAL